MTGSWYLRPDVVIEPLVDQWYAWSYIVAPATAAMHLAHRHIRIMESYIDAPDVHAAAVNSAALRGGPFVDLGGARVDDVSELLERTRARRRHLLDFAAAVAEANALLRREARGMSLEPLYSRLPQILRGYVELVYDLESRPSLRFIEPLLYRSQYYDPSSQSFLLFRMRGCDRPFVLSTPRLEDDRSLHWQIPFGDPIIDELCRSRSAPCDVGAMMEKLPAGEKTSLLREFFCREPPSLLPHQKTREPRWRYFGHACVLLDGGGQSVLVDPVLNYTGEGGDLQYTLLDLPERIDFVLITHNHQDHVALEMLLQIRHKIGTIIVPRVATGNLQDPSLKLLLREIGFNSVVEMDALDSVEIEGGEIVGLPFLGEHGDLDVRSKLAYLVRLNNKSFLFVADSRNVDSTLYKHIRRLVGPIDTLFVGMECDGAPLSWTYGPLLTTPIEHNMDRSRRTAGSDSEQALAIVEAMGCKSAYVYAMGLEPWLNYISRFRYSRDSPPIVESDRFVRLCRERGVAAERLYGGKEVCLRQ